MISAALTLASFVSLLGVSSGSQNEGSTIIQSSTTAHGLTAVNTTTSLEGVSIERLHLAGPNAGSVMVFTCKTQATPESIHLFATYHFVMSSFLPLEDMVSTRKALLCRLCNE